MIEVAGDDPPRLTDTQLLTSLGAGGVGFHTKGSFRRELIAYLVHVYIMRYQSSMESSNQSKQMLPLFRKADYLSAP